MVKSLCTFFRRSLNTAALGGVALLAATLLPGLAKADGIACMPINVFQNLVQKAVLVECAVAQNGVKYVALSTAAATPEDQGRASRFIKMATAAQLSGQKFFVWTSDNTALNPAGCSAGNCRRADQWGLQK